MKELLGLRSLLSEIDCRIDRGSNDHGHLNYVRNQLVGILYGKDQMLTELELHNQIHKRVGGFSAIESERIASNTKIEMPF